MRNGTGGGNASGVLGDAVSIAVPWCRGWVGVSQGTRLMAYTPAIDHGQDSGRARGGRCGLDLKARVQNVNHLNATYEACCTPG